jgi:hypothetical protein
MFTWFADATVAEAQHIVWKLKRDSRLMLQKVWRIDLYSLILFCNRDRKSSEQSCRRIVGFWCNKWQLQGPILVFRFCCKRFAESISILLSSFARFLCSDFLVSYSRFHLQHAERIIDIGKEDTGKDRQTDRDGSDIERWGHCMRVHDLQMQQLREAHILLQMPHQQQHIVWKPIKKRLAVDGSHHLHKKVWRVDLNSLVLFLLATLEIKRFRSKSCRRLLLSCIVLQHHKETEHNSLLSLVPRFTESLTPQTSPRIFRSAANRIRIGFGFSWFVLSRDGSTSTYKSEGWGGKDLRMLQPLRLHIVVLTQVGN